MVHTYQFIVIDYSALFASVNKAWNLYISHGFER